MNFLFLAMTLVVASSNYLVQFPINEWLTYGAFTYPITFLITEISNRFYGPKIARKVVYAGFAVAVVLSTYLSTFKIAAASGFAFLIAQLLDISVFNRLRQQKWWIAPFAASVLASLVDTIIFWNLAFIGEGVPVASLAAGDFALKLALDLMMLMPYRLTVAGSALETRYISRRQSHQQR